MNELTEIINEIYKFKNFTTDEKNYIVCCLNLAYALGEREQMKKALEDLRNQKI